MRFATIVVRSYHRPGLRRKHHRSAAMCGISGVLNFNRKPVSPEVLEAMIRTVAHRGPDASGLFVERELGLAHARLSIIDVAGGQQPMHSDDGSLWIAFNGEIFNYLELRSDL